MRLRRTLFALLVTASGAGLACLLWTTLAVGGWTTVKALIFLCFLPVAPWLGICVANAVIGFWFLLTKQDAAAAVFPLRGDFAQGPVTARVAVAMTVRNEDLRAILPGLRRLMADLDPAHFIAWILSDTQDPVLAAAEAAAMAGLPIRYRRRAENSGFKAGNVMEFLENHAEGIDFVVMLDADSVMSAAAVQRMVRMMQAAPKLAIVQHLTVGLPAESAFPRMFQFGMRAGMRVWATGQCWWQGMEGPYWGHNAVLRAAAFRAHAKLAPLPDGSVILSHDQMEAALLCGAGYGVAVWAGEDGSQEANPPALPEFLARDERWMAGNMQYRWLLGMAGLKPMGRWQLVQAILLFAGAPFYTAIAVLACWCHVLGEPVGDVKALAVAWALALYSPKLLGYLEVLLFARLRRAYGGGWRLFGSAVAEMVFTLLLDAIMTPHKTLAMGRLFLGWKAGWLPQNRASRGVGWGEAARMFWPHTLLGVLLVAGFGASWALVFVGGLVVAIPFSVLSASPVVSRWAKAVCQVPEEIAAGVNVPPGGAAG